MEEIERYKWSQDVIEECAYEDYDYIVDTENNIIFDDDNYFKLVDILNQQDQRIKELENENQQLKQQLKEYSELGTPKEIDDTYRSRNILYNNLQDANRIIDDLVKQLHELPKKIVCEISEAIERLSWRKRIYTNWEFDKEQLYKDLDTILKKYGGENDL